MFLDRIVTTRMQRMTAEQTPQTEQQPLKWAMSFNSFHRILGTGRVETTTGAKEGRNTYPVKSDKDDEYFPQDSYEYAILHLRS